jgi:shikimate dehydrogenase
MDSKLDGATRLFPIIGDPIKYVESPFMLSRAFASRGLNAVCIPMQVSDDGLKHVIAALTVTSNVDGILITMPHKFTSYAYCATSSERSRLFNVVSVIRRNPDRTWHGDILDGLAFVKAQKDNGAIVEGRRALLVGAGGAGSAVAAALLESGIGEIVVHDINQSRTERLLSLLSEVGLGRITTGPPDPSGCDLVFNATSMGMNDSDPLPIDTTTLTSSMFVGDVIAGHVQTPFISAATAAGCKTANGGDMVLAAQDLIADFMIGNSVG